MVHKWTNIKAVLAEVASTIPSDLWRESDAIEWAAIAMDKIGAQPQYEHAIHFDQVVNHKVCLPKGLVQVHMIAYKLNSTLTQEDLDAIERSLGIDDEVNMESSGLAIQAYLANRDFTNAWAPLRLSTNAFALSVHCDNCANIDNSCNETYTISPNGIITTSFNTGYVCISYYRYPTDSEGNFLIPENAEYVDALRKYIMMRIWEKRRNMKEEGADSIYKDYRAEWSLAKARATADVRDPDVNQMENLKNIYTRLIPKTRRYAGFFGNLSSEELINMQGFSTGSLLRT